MRQPRSNIRQVRCRLCDISHQTGRCKKCSTIGHDFGLWRSTISAKPRDRTERDASSIFSTRRSGCDEIQCSISTSYSQVPCFHGAIRITHKPQELRSRTNKQATEKHIEVARHRQPPIWLHIPYCKIRAGDVIRKVQRLVVAGSTAGPMSDFRGARTAQPPSNSCDRVKKIDTPPSVGDRDCTEIAKCRLNDHQVFELAK